MRVSLWLYDVAGHGDGVEDEETTEMSLAEVLRDIDKAKTPRMAAVSITAHVVSGEADAKKLAAAVGSLAEFSDGAWQVEIPMKAKRTTSKS
jgi:hypothetical protein